MYEYLSRRCDDANTNQLINARSHDEGTSFHLRRANVHLDICGREQWLNKRSQESKTCCIPARSTKAKSMAWEIFEVVNIITFGFDLSWSNCVSKAFTTYSNSRLWCIALLKHKNNALTSITLLTRIESEGSDPERAAWRAAAKLSTSSESNKQKYIMDEYHEDCNVERCRCHLWEWKSGSQGRLRNRGFAGRASGRACQIPRTTWKTS